MNVINNDNDNKRKEQYFYPEQVGILLLRQQQQEISRLSIPILGFRVILAVLIAISGLMVSSLLIPIPIVAGEPIPVPVSAEASALPGTAAALNANNSSTNATNQPVSPIAEECKPFTHGITQYEITSPLYPENYPDNIECIKLIQAKQGHRIQIRLVERFQLEEHPDCRYDYLEARNGQFGYSTLLGRFCGNIPPTPILGTGHYMWLKFHSDAGINYGGFKAVITMVPSSDFTPPTAECKAILTGDQGDFSSDELMANVPLSEGATTCAWVIEAAEGKKISLKFEDYKLQRPNDCGYNFVEVYRTREDYDGRNTQFDDEKGTHKFCGTQSENIKSRDNFLAVRFFAMKFNPEDTKRSTFKANFTVYRQLSATQQKPSDPPETCDRETEFACGDTTCVSKDLHCNQKLNCDSRTDEESCPSTNKAGVTPDILVIGLVGCILIFGMCAGLILNIYRKLKQDREEISELKEALRKSRESVPETNRIRHDPSAGGGSAPGPSTSASRASSDSKVTIIERKPPPPFYTNATPPQPPSSAPSLPTTNPPKPPVIPPNGDIKPLIANKPSKYAVPVDTVALITYQPPPSYPSKVSVRPKAAVPPEDLSSIAVGTDDISSLASSDPKAEGEEQIIEVRDVACQTRSTAPRDFGFGRNRRAPLAREDAIYEVLPVQKRVARRYPLEAMPRFPSFSSASSETGRSLERLDELTE